MKIIATDKITTPSALFSVFGSYLASYVSDRFPSKKWISSSPWEEITLTNASGLLGAGLYVDDRDIDTITYVYFKSSAALTISTITGTGPTVTITTSAAHGLSNGDTVYLTDMVQSIELNYNTYAISSVTATTFVITATITAYSSGGGTVRKVHSSGTLSKWADLTYDSAVESTLLLRMHNTTDINTAANLGIDTWESAGSNADGRFKDGSTVVSLEDSDGNPAIPVGTIFTLSATNDIIESIAHAAGANIVLTMTGHPFVAGDYVRITSSGDSKLDNRVFYVQAKTADTVTLYRNSSTSTVDTYVDIPILTGNVRKIYQITAINGDGSVVSSVTISPNPAVASGTVVDVLHPVKTGTIRCGLVDDYPNPDMGLGEGRNDYSIRITTSNGHLFTRKRNIARMYESLTFQLTSAEYQTLMDFADSQGPHPFACLLLESMGDSNRHALLGYFPSLPRAQFSFRTGTYKTVQINLHEVI